MLGAFDLAIMYLTKHQTAYGPRWASDGHWLPTDFRLGLALQLRSSQMHEFLAGFPASPQAQGPLMACLDDEHEVWASGVTYLRSREARESETQVKDIYDRVYEAARPELFFKAIGRRVVAHGQPIRVRRDAKWTVPEPEVTLVVNAHHEIVGFCIGNDVSSRDIEGENPLYLPQAKVYDGACALGPGIELLGVDEITKLELSLKISRAGEPVFSGETSVAQMKRRLSELVEYLMAELEFPEGVLLLTGTGVVPDDAFTLKPGDEVSIAVGGRTLHNSVGA